MGEEVKVITSKGVRYQAIRKLGEGYAGEVFLVRDEQAGETRALKLLNPEAFKEGQLEAFKREFITLSGLHHPHLCKVYDFGFSESEGRYFFTSELIQGTDLYTFTEKLSIKEIEDIFVQITDALGFIHAAGLIHFDIKGANILMTTVDGKALAKVVDFGLATPSVSTHENIVGTVRYISPEMIKKNQAIDYRADLYSLGMVLYRMIARRYPNQGSTMKEVLDWHAKHTSIEKSPLEEQGAPKYLIEIIEKLLNPIPAERFSSASVIIKYIELHSGRSYKKSQRELLTTLTEEGPLVGRDDVMFAIRPALHKLSKKEPPEESSEPTLVLAGPAGIGKTRMLKEAKYISQLNELQTVVIRGQEDGRDIESFVKAAGISSVASDGTKTQAKDIVSEILARQQMCLMVDDLDQCNQSVRDIIVGLVSSLYTAKFMGKQFSIYMILTMTSGGSNVPLPVPLHLGVEVEHLKPFSKEDITQYLRLLLGESNPPLKQIEDIYKFSGGIPELVKTAIASLESSTARLTRDTTQFFVAHIKQLNSQARRLLGFLAMAEKPLSHQQLIVLTESMIEAALAEMITTGIIVHNRDAETYDVATGAVSYAAKEALSKSELKDISSHLLAAALEEVPQDIDAIVRYASISAEPEAACEFVIKAAEAKEEKAEMDQAYRYYQQALGMLAETDARVPDIHRKLARYLLLTGKYQDATEHINVASKLTKLTVQDLTALSWIERLQQKAKEALVYIQKAADFSEVRSDEPEFLRLLNEKALCYLQMGNIEEAIKIFSDTNERANGLPEDKKNKVVNNNLGMALAQAGKFDEAIKFYRKKYEGFESDRRISASVLSQLGYVYQQAGRLDEALEASKKGWELSSAVGDMHGSAAILGNIINLCQSKSLFTDALHYAQESTRLASQAASEKELATNFLTIGSLYINLGLEDVAQKYLNEAAAIFQKLEDSRMEAWVQMSFACLYKNLNKSKEATAYFNNVIKRGEKVNDKELAIWGHCGAAEILMEGGDIKQAEEHMALIESPWPGASRAREKEIKVEIIRLKLAIKKDASPEKEIVAKLEELAALALKQGLRELAGEAYHALTTYYQRVGDELTSAKYISKAKSIIEDIAGTLSEEYRDSFLKQQFRRMIFEESVRLERSISHISASKLSEEETPARSESPSPSSAPAIQREDRTIDIPGGGAEALGVPKDAYKLIGHSEAMTRIRQLVEEVKNSAETILIEGEQGTEKEFIARVIQNEGVYKGRPWKEVDVSFLSEEYLRADLFGGDEEGVLESAHDGIVFLKNIEGMPGSLQKDIAKVLKRGKLVSLRYKIKVPLKARIIASTNMTVEKLIKEKRFNKKFLKRISSIFIHTPTLMERREDVPLLINHYLRMIEAEVKLSRSFDLETGAVQALMEYNWPGNSKELLQVLRNCCMLCKGYNITEEQVRLLLKK